MTMESVYDSIVVGAGIEGSSTAYHLRKQGQKTLLLEQFPLPHSRGSSHGQSRITRKAYGPDDFYTSMMHESYRCIEELEKETGENLYVQCGLLVMGPATDPFISGTISSLRKHNIPYRELDSAEMKRKYPMMSFPDNWRFVLEKEAGVLRADKVLRGFQSQFIRHGGVIRDGEAVTDILSGEVVTVKTVKGEYKSKSVVVAVGAWAPTVLRKLGLHVPLQPLRITVCYWKEKRGCHDSKHFPTFLSQTGKGTFDVYGMPAEEYPGHVKICLHDGPKIDPDCRDAVDAGWVQDRMKKYVEDHFPWLVPVPSITETCIYTMSPDEHFYIDYHPSWSNIIIAAGFSGHGFKLSPVIGKVLSEMAMGREPSYTIAPFKLNRFDSKPSKL